MTAADPSYSRRWLILAVVGVAQVMVVVDATVVNIALPSTQRALHFSNGDRQWVAAISAVGGLAQSFGWLVAARAAQGAPNERRADHRAALDTALGRGASAVPCDHSSVPCDEGSPARRRP